MNTKNELFLADGPVTVRPLCREDAPCLLKWMTDPRVLEWYEGRDQVFTPERVEEDFFGEEPYDVRRCIIEYQNRPVGYLQIYRLDDELREEYRYQPEQPEAVCFSVDQFLGEPELWGRHIGRTFLSLAVRHLTGAEGAYSVVLDPHANNLRALRCYEAVGFRKVKLLPAHELHEGTWEDCWLMEYRGN